MWNQHYKAEHKVESGMDAGFHCIFDFEAGSFAEWCGRRDVAVPLLRFVSIYGSRRDRVPFPYCRFNFFAFEES